MKANQVQRQVRGWIVLTACLAMVSPVRSQVTNIFTIDHWQNPQPYSQVVNGYPDGTGAQFGAAVTAIGGGKFAVGVPFMDVLKNLVQPQGFVADAGFVYTYDATGTFDGSRTVPLTDQRRQYGRALSAFADGRLLTGTADARTNAAGTVINSVGRVHLHDPAGTLLSTWENPDGLAANHWFGHTVAAIGENRFAASSMSGFGQVFVFDSTAVAEPLATILNPQLGYFPFNPDFSFGSALCPLGNDRLIIGNPYYNGGRGAVYIYDLNGTLLRTIIGPTDSSWFGMSVAMVDDHRFLVGAPYQPVSYGAGQVNDQAGAVYLYSDSGTLLKTFTPPAPALAGGFGQAIAMFGEDRVLIGEPYDFWGPYTGSVHLFNLDAVFFETVGNPSPNAFDRFGETIAAINDRQFVVGAPANDNLISGTTRSDAGSIFGFDAPAATAFVGEKLFKPAGLSTAPAFTQNGPTVTPAGAAFWHVLSQELIAVAPAKVLVTWPLSDGSTYNWEATVDWPEEDDRYQLHVAGTTPVDLTGGGAFNRAVLFSTSTDADSLAVSNTVSFTASTPGVSLLMLSPGEPVSNPIVVQRVRTVLWNNPAYLHAGAAATVGQPVMDPGGYHNPLLGAPQVVLSNSPYLPHAINPVTRRGTIIPVNRSQTPPEEELARLVVAYYAASTTLTDPTTGLVVSNSIAWPWKPVQFISDWPANPQRIAIASRQGTGVIDPSQYVDWELYYQNDPNQTGFNPNDEHAIRRTVAGGEAVFPLRNDLGTVATSDPYVIIAYRDPAAGLDWRARVFRVVAEEAPFFFQYPAEAGRLLQPPFPTNAFSLNPQGTGISGPFFKDRKNSFWASAAGDDGGSTNIVVHYFYPMLPEFFSPGPNPPAPGDPVPFLDQAAGTPGIPINVGYSVTWPAVVPELRFGDSLIHARNGLPEIANQASAEVIYQQSLAQAVPASSVRLVDPVKARSVILNQLPSGLNIRTESGLQYFPDLPPHLQSRLSYDPLGMRLRWSGEIVEPPAGDPYILLNVISAREKAELLVLNNDLSFQNALTVLSAVAGSVEDVERNSPGFDALALTTGGSPGTGYVTLAFGNSATLNAPDDPVSLSVLRVTCPSHAGAIAVFEEVNPLTERLTLRHTGDFGGRPGDYQFEWRTLPPEGGFPSPLPPEQWGLFVPSPVNGIGANDISITGPGILTIADNYFVCRYRRVDGGSACAGEWSGWTTPMLAEGWIKRVLAGIGPFEQRVEDYQNSQANTIVSMISQAGARSVGAVALNLDAVNEVGLIEFYETVFDRGVTLSIEGVPAVDYAPANDALLLAAGRLADLYMLLGNEAYADAADPTIAFGTDDGIYGSQATSLHCFMNQTGSLLEEELALLRGRDDSRLPSVQTYPFYNRLIWNFTQSANGGQVAYALNYNLRDVDGDVAGSINEADARALYPQGHGDAWGHYLMAIKNYYRLMRNPNFTWQPRVETVLVGGVPVSVDFLDERKFAAAAAARAKTGAEIVNLTFRSDYVENPTRPWQDREDNDPDRAWSLADWSSRAGQGAFFDWVVANAILPDVDTNLAHTGIQKVDRQTVKELAEIREAYREIADQQDQADSGRNPLGLARNVVPFDIDPAGITAGKTHFEQVNERATEALRNAVAVFDHANASTQLLRRQADDAAQFQQRVQERETDYNNRLIEIFGTPYPDDIGPGRTYPTGYNGPDIYHFEYVEDLERVISTAPQPILNVRFTEEAVTPNGGLVQSVRTIPFNYSAFGLGIEKPSTWSSQRAAPGEIQLARLSALGAFRRAQQATAQLKSLLGQVEDARDLLAAQTHLQSQTLEIRQNQLGVLQKLNQAILDLRLRAETIRDENGLVNSIVGVNPGNVVQVLGNVALGLLDLTGIRDPDQLEIYAAAKEDKKGELALQADLQIMSAQGDVALQERLAQISQLWRQVQVASLEQSAASKNLEESVGRVRATIARGARLLEERTRFRQQTAAQIQAYRNKDMAFRIFRSDALQKYRAQFDLASRYAYLAAKAYDYETCLAPNDPRGPGSAFLTSIIHSRSLGLIGPSGPLQGSGSGDPGLADPLARMNINWNLVLEGQLGFNNPQTETGRFSLRSELFRILNGTGGSQRWRETLSSHVVPNLLKMPEFQRHCIPFSPTQPAEPAIVIPFATTINFGLNFFGWPAGGGDNDYDSTKFATRVRSVGVWFANYNNLGGGMINTPRVYLIPVGLDVMRSPSQGDAYIREWRILDQALPVPFPLSAGSLSDPDWIPISDSLSEEFAAIRRFGRFRAYHDSGNFNPAETITDTRLIGRSVWNTRWLLIIPAGTLHTDRNEGIQRFINGGLKPDGTRDGNGVSDIKIFFQTYAYSGS